ncbi:hypothetical protein FB390_3731 [Nocardia bhagyanarayanae]|uniref:Uncharacterized protein n=1 Tax=Nocardia bhagyanarayanae TaxID=1215925 RepID=A0A543FDV7_9NOCA|nr:hypothetical protein FB390_3731 [Nocardia bhagyanarayanae]
MFRWALGIGSYQQFRAARTAQTYGASVRSISLKWGINLDPRSDRTVRTQIPLVSVYERYSAARCEALTRGENSFRLPLIFDLEFDPSRFMQRVARNQCVLEQSGKLIEGEISSVTPELGLDGGEYPPGLTPSVPHGFAHRKMQRPTRSAVKIAIERPSAGSLRDPVRRRGHTFPPPESFAALLQLTLQLALLVRCRVATASHVKSPMTRPWRSDASHSSTTASRASESVL